MPGIFGTYNRKLENIEKKLNLLKHDEDWFEGEILEKEYSQQIVCDFSSKVDEQYFLKDDISIVLFGDIYSYDDNIVEGDQAEFIYKLYNSNDNFDFLRFLDGSFVFSIHDENETFIVNDRLGSKNLYYFSPSNKLIYSSEIKTILDEIDKPSFNFEAISEFFTFSFMLEDKTFYKNIGLLPPGSILSINEKDITIEKYADLDIRRREMGEVDIQSLYKDFDRIMGGAIEKRIKEYDKVGVFLSGGLDSRLLTAYVKKIADKYDIDVITFTFGTKGGIQEEIAKKISNKLDVKNIFYEIPSDSISNYAEEVVYKGDGQTRIRDCHFISLLERVRKDVDKVILGFFCSELFGELIPESIEESKNKEEMFEKMLNTYRTKHTAPHLKYLIDGVDNIESMPLNNFKDVIMDIDQPSYGTLTDHFEVRQMARREILPLTNYINWYLEPITPFLDKNILNFALNLPLKLRKDKKFIHKFIWQAFPGIAKIEWERSGVPPDTEGLHLFYSRAKRFAKNKIKKSIQRITKGDVLYKSNKYRAYEYWLRTGSQDYVEKILLNPTLNFWNEGYIKKIVSEHMDCSENNDQLICDLLNIELINRLFLSENQ